jgi:serine/threonine protein kinase/class 3 adenylate cyclase
MTHKVLNDPGSALSFPRSRPDRNADESIVFSRYQLLGQLSSGRDGIRYRAVDPEAPGALELVVLSDLGGDVARSRERARRLRTAAMLAHPTAGRIITLGLDHVPPFVVLEAIDEPTWSGQRSSREAIAAAGSLAAGLAEAHRLGLGHGQIEPGTVFLQGASRPKIDWTGLAVDAAIDRAMPLPFLAPECRRGGGPTPAADVFALGTLLSRWVGGPDPGQPRRDVPESPGDLALDRLIQAMHADDPAERPPAREVHERLASLLDDSTIGPDGIRDMVSLDSTVAFVPGSVVARDPSADSIRVRARLGRFLLHEKLGEGGMGSVYRGEDITDQTIVAIKVLRENWVERPGALLRLRKEARLLAEANNPFVTNLIEVNEDDGIHYLALEYVHGTSLAQWLVRFGRLTEPLALAILADVARGLAVAHERGIIHRDIKPENVLLVGADDLDEPVGSDAATVEFAPADTPPKVKLSDFGLARHVEETESLDLTQAGAIVGTPRYMAPEQCLGTETLGPPADVYAMGAMLFHLLTGRTPFDAPTALALIEKHRSEPPPPLKEINPLVSDGVAQVVAKALAKRPGERYADAGEMLLDLERLLRGEPTAISIHPRLPTVSPRDLVQFDFRWELDAPPHQLWPYVSNTERLNRALGLSPASFTAEYDSDEGLKRFGRFRTSGIQVGWREYPYEWVEGRRMGVFREFGQGPFQWFVSTVELLPRAGGGTILTHGIRVAAKGLFGRTLARVKLGNQGHKSMDRVYRRIDAALTGKLGRDPLIDPFEPPPAPSKGQQRRLDGLLGTLAARGIEPLVIERLGDFLALAPPQELARIRPLALARRLGLDADQVVAACLLGARDGALILLWDLLCPVCRIPSDVMETLRALRDHGHCEACRLDYDLDFTNSVEMIFRPHPTIRETELKTYCIGGPAHSPHVAAQVRIGPGERLALDLTLGEGSYRLRGPQLAYSIDFHVEPGAAVKRLDLTLGHGDRVARPRRLCAGEQHLGLTNDTERELVVRVERTAPRDDAFTAARASALALFRELFPGEVLAPGQVVNVETVTLLVTELAHPGDLYQELGDARAFALIHEHFRIVNECLSRHGGALVKTINEASVAAFTDPVAALDAALALAPALALGNLTRDLTLRVGIHRGPAMVATLNDHLDYFGATVRVALQLPRLALDGAVVVSQAIAAEPGVAVALQPRQLRLTLVPADLAGLPESFVHRIGDPEP